MGIMRRYLRANHAERVPSSHIVIDVEGTPVQTAASGAYHVHYFRHAVATAWRWEGGKVTRDSTVSLDSIDGFWRWLTGRLDPKRVTWVWGHSIGYDLTALRVWEMIERGDLHFGGATTRSGRDVTAGKPPRVWSGCIVTGDPPTILSARTRGGRGVKFVDVLNWCNCTVDELAEALRLEPPARAGDAEDERSLDQRMRRRLAILRLTVEEIVAVVRDQCLGNMASTIAGQAHHAWRHPEIPCRILPTGDEESRRLERAAYYGGRCHCYYVGSVVESQAAGLERLTGANPLMPTAAVGPVYHLDVVACYGSVMRDNRYPVDLRRVMIDPAPDEVRAALGAYCVIADVGLHTVSEAYPLRRGGETGYYVGRFRTQLAGPELSRALEQGAVKEVYRAQVYVANRPFDGFVNRCWRIRNLYTLSGHKLRARLAKHLMATLHGKLAQRSPRWEVVLGMRAPQPWGQYCEIDGQTRRITHYRSVGGVVQRRGDDAEPDGALPAISAYITSYARELLREIRLDAGHHGTLYEDADSLHVTRSGYDELARRGWIDEHTPGRCRVVATADRGVYYGRKDYELGDKLVRAGRQREAVQKPAGDWHQTDYARLDALLAGQPPAGPVAYDRSLTLEHPPCGSGVDPDGWTRHIRLS